MKTTIKNFKTEDFHTALQGFFSKLNIPVNYLAEEPAKPGDILGDKYNQDKDSCKLIDDVYFLGMVDDAAFEGARSLDPDKIKSDYDGILIFGVTLYPRENNLLPTRTQLADITRTFNQTFHYTPVMVVFKYTGLIAFANAERLKYKQEWREGEKAGKVSLLRDIAPDNPHSGHLRILAELAISRTGKKGINTFADLYAYWQTVFNVSLLNKKFYEELSNWYFWAVKEVSFPFEPTIHSLFEETGSNDDNKLAEAIQEHKAKNVIRLLTRFLFVWFIKEKKLIPTQLFDREYLETELLNDLSPFHASGPQGNLFQDKTANKKSHYYKAILQNLFFATLNQEMGKRGFRADKQHMNVTNLLRYEDCFVDQQKFVDLVEAIVPFMNGGLFECLDKPHPTKKGPRGGDVIIYKDGFSDRNDNPLTVPDYLFFGVDEEVDLSSVIGIKNKKTKQAAVKGLINIFNSYKFTIAENTPIEEDIALDPELLGKVFENLLASYNPETKTTARKQTGSFYTPREIVNYMVDESLIAYLKNEVDWQLTEEEQDSKLHELLSFDPGNPFAEDLKLQKAIIKALDHCTILDPACGSGAFPMGILQKMVHVLQKLDPLNTHWQELQMEKAMHDTESAFHLTDKKEREQKLIEINEAFDQQINDPDYARKLFLIENCIYGVDIQPVAVQISKLRFFISLVVEQKVDKSKSNFGIRPLPNLETKFVAANTLIGIEKPEGELFTNQEIKAQEKELKNLRHRIFSAKTPGTKRKLRNEDQELRIKMGALLVADGWGNTTANQLAGWDPYDQNASSGFFDLEWMFGLKDGFDVVIGNPPYVQIQKFSGQQCQKDWESQGYHTFAKTGDIYCLFCEKGNQLLKNKGCVCLIISNKWMLANYGKKMRHFLTAYTNPLALFDFGSHHIFESAIVDTCIILFKKENNKKQLKGCSINKSFNSQTNLLSFFKNNHIVLDNLGVDSWVISSKIELGIKNQIEEVGVPLKNWDVSINYGIKTGFNEAFIISKEKRDALIAADPKSAKILKPVLRGKDIKRYQVNFAELWLINSHNGCFDRKNNNRVEAVNIDLYLAVKAHLDEYWEAIKKRYDKGKTPYNLRNCAYLPEFEEKKIVWGNLALNAQFALAKPGMFINAPSPLINTGNKYLLAVLNSTLSDYYIRTLGVTRNGGYFEYKPMFVEKLPIPQISKQQQILFVNLVDLLLFCIEQKRSNFSLEFIIDGLVFELYFSDHMKEKQIDILQFVESDIAEVMQDQDFDKLSDIKKEEIINQLHTKWTHPDSEVRNRIKLFAVRSPDILKPIMESK